MQTLLFSQTVKPQMHLQICTHCTTKHLLTRKTCRYMQTETTFFGDAVVCTRHTHHHARVIKERAKRRRGVFVDIADVGWLVGQGNGVGNGAGGGTGREGGENKKFFLSSVFCTQNYKQQACTTNCAFPPLLNEFCAETFVCATTEKKFFPPFLHSTGVQ